MPAQLSPRSASRPSTTTTWFYVHRWAVRRGPLEEGDIGDRARLDAVIARHRPAALMQFATAHGRRWIALRSFNAPGANPDGKIGERHNPETHLIPLVLDTAASERLSITVYGEDYDTPDGTCIRDSIHVSDPADA